MKLGLWPDELEIAEKAFEAGAKAAMESAAKACDAEHESGERYADDRWAAAAKCCADAIRALPLPVSEEWER